MAELQAPNLEDLQTNGISVASVTWPVHMTLMGDYSFTTPFDGHAGATCRFPCGYCCCLARPSAASKALLPNYADYGTLLDGSRAGRVPCTLLHKSGSSDLYANGPLAAMEDPPAVSITLSYERRPLPEFAPEDIVLIPLHTMPGVSPWLLSLGAEAVAFDSGASRAEEYATALSRALRIDVGVSPAPLWGGTFAGRACHRIGRCLAPVCDVSDQFVPQSRAAAYRRSRELCADLLPVLNRASMIAAPERATFRRQAAEFCGSSSHSFEWASSTPKLHILACHAADWLDRYGSVGLLAEHCLEGRYG